MAVQTIKAVARRRWTGSARPHPTWYEPLARQPDIDAAVHWVLAHPGVFLNTAGDMTLLPRILDAAARFTAPPTTTTLRRPPQPRIGNACSRCSPPPRT